MTNKACPDSNVGIEVPRNLASTAGHKGMFAEQAAFTVLALTRGVNLFTNNAYDLRGHLPDPIDLPNHIGNTALTIGLLAPLMYGFDDGLRIKPATPEQLQTRNRRAAYTIGALAVTANIVGETVGYGSISTPDFYDFVYGLAGGALLYRWTKPAYIPPERVKALKNILPEDDAYRQLIDRLVSDAPQPKPKSSPSTKPRKTSPHYRRSPRRKRQK